MTAQYLYTFIKPLKLIHCFPAIGSIPSSVHCNIYLMASPWYTYKGSQCMRIDRDIPSALNEWDSWRRKEKEWRGTCWFRTSSSGADTNTRTAPTRHQLDWENKKWSQIKFRCEDIWKENYSMNHFLQIILFNFGRFLSGWDSTAALCHSHPSHCCPFVLGNSKEINYDEMTPNHQTWDHHVKISHDKELSPFFVTVISH